MKTSLDFFDHIGTIFDHLLSSQGTLSLTWQNTILQEMSFLSTFAEQSASKFARKRITTAKYLFT